MEENGVMMPVVNLTMDYKRPAKYDDVLTIKTTLLKLPSVKILLSYEVFNESNELLTTGSSTLVFVDMKTNKPTRCPEPLLLKFNRFFV